MCKVESVFLRVWILLAVGVVCMGSGVLLAEGARPSKSRIKSKEVVVRYVEEKLNGHSFVHRVDIVNGERKEQWAIDGNLVSEEEYEEALLEAEKAVRRIERKEHEVQRCKQERELSQQQEFVRSSRLAIEKKRLGLVLAQVDDELKKLRDPKLVPYYTFGTTSGFSTEESFETFCDDMLPHARSLYEGQQSLLEEVSKVADSLEQHRGRISSTFRATVNNAINKCNDTRLLKELLEVVA